MERWQKTREKTEEKNRAETEGMKNSYAKRGYRRLVDVKRNRAPSIELFSG